MMAHCIRQDNLQCIIGERRFAMSKFDGLTALRRCYGSYNTKSGDPDHLSPAQIDHPGPELIL